jgi:DNA (cytosine-5)-methyltransferase 1
MALLPSPRTSDTNGAGHHGDGGMDLRTAVAEIPLLPTPACNDMGAAYTPETWDEWTAKMKAKHNNGNGHGPSLNVEVQRMLLPTPTRRDHKDTEVRREPHRPEAVDTLSRALMSWGDYEPAIRRWEAVTRPAPEPTKLNAKGNPKLSDEFDEWLMGYPAGWITDVPGVTWNEALKACGNGVVPMQGSAALAALLEMAHWNSCEAVV